MNSELTHSPHRWLTILAVAVIVLLLSAASAIGNFVSTETDATETEVAVAEATSADDETTQSVAMKIDIEAGDVLDLETGREVVVETWDGDDVLVVVRRSGLPAVAGVRPKELDIKVTRRGRNVHIATLDQSGRPFNDPSLSLSIIVPKLSPAAAEVGKVSSIYDLSKLTHLVFRALHREAMSWVGR